jgi:predicted TIM-barrel fold metal-dependent hydrolase
MRIDAHVHLWNIQNGKVNGKPVYDIGGGRSDFGGEIRQMMPPYLLDGKNTAEYLIANMDYACVNGCVVTQEYIDGNQDAYLLKVKKQFPERVKVCSLYEEKDEFRLNGFDGVKMCGGRMIDTDLTKIMPVFKKIEASGKFLGIDLAEGDIQTGSLREVIEECPDLPIAIGHFGMVNRAHWQEQIKLARNKNVYIESGGITWLFHQEYYPYPSAVRAILEAAEICGMDKLMWGSDYPRTMTAITYQMSYDFVEKSKEMTQEEKEMFLGKNAKYFYGFQELSKLEKIKNMVED